MGMYQLSEDTAITEVGDEYVMLDLKEGKYFSVNSVGRLMLDLVREHDDKESVVDQILNQFEGDRASVSNDLDEFVAELCSVGLLHSPDNPG